MFLLLIIPAIIFTVYWIFGIYILFDEKKGIRESLRRSREIVRGKWWRVLGNSLLIGLILIGIYFALTLISFPTQIIYNNAILNGESISTQFIVLNSLLGWLSNFLISLISIPIPILFFKNLYFDLKKKPSATQQKTTLKTNL